MKWGNYIKRTAVRRAVWIVVGIAVYGVLSLLGVVGDAQAGLLGCGPGDQCARPEALALCEQHGSNSTYAQNTVVDCGTGGEPNAVSGSYLCYITRPDGTNRTSCIGAAGDPRARYYWTGACPAGTTWNEVLGQCHAGCSAASTTSTSRPPFYPGDRIVPNGTGQCSDDACLRVFHNNFDGTWTGTPTGDVCVPNQPPDCSAGIIGGLGYISTPEGCMPPPVECAEGETRDAETGACKGGCPAGMSFNDRNECVVDKDTCPAGQVKGPDGSCVSSGCPAGQARGGDGSCKPDSDGDGTPDEDEEGGQGDNKDGKKFSGGESCEFPPQCSGDAIMCGQARIQWRIDCNTRRVSNISGGSCEAMPICTDGKCDGLEYAQLVQQWKTSCSLQNLANAEGGVGGDGVEERLDRIANFLDGDGDCMATEEGCGEGGDDHWIDGDDVEASDWSSGLASTGSCPAPISRTVSLGQYVQDIEFSYQPLCDFAALIRWVLITAATILSALMIGGFRSNA